MLHDRHQLDVREAEVGDVGGELIGELEVVERPIALEGIPPPGTEMNLVDRHRLVQRVALRAAREPLIVCPRMLRPMHDRRVCGRTSA